MKEKVKTFLKKNWLYLLCSIVVGCFLLINLNSLSNKLNIEGGELVRTNKIIFLVVSAGLAVIVWLITRKIKEKENNYQKLFVILGAILGVTYLLLAPFFAGSDEHNHFYRIYEITEGVINTSTAENYSGGELPKSLVDTFGVAHFNNARAKYEQGEEMMAIPLERDNKIVYNSLNNETCYASASLYSPVSYVPHLVGVSAGKMFSLGPYFLGMLGRLFNLAFYLLIGYFAIKLMPRGKLFYLLILLSPNMLQCATTLSVDAYMNATCLLLIAMVLEARYEAKRMTPVKMALMVAISIVVSLCKICYAPLILLFGLIRKEQFKYGRKEKIIYIVGTLVVCAVLTLLWTKATSPIFDAAYPHAMEQKDYIIGNPLGYMIVLIRSVINDFVASVECLFVGTRMYQSQLEIPAILSFFYVGLVAVAALKKERNVKNELSGLEKGGIGAIAVMVVGLILTALYLQCTASLDGGGGGEVVHGTQGRYFIPLVFLIPLVIGSKYKKKILNERIMIFLSLAVSLVTWFYMMERFIV